MRTVRQVDAEIMLQWQSFQDCDATGDFDHADDHYRRMDILLEERATCRTQGQPPDA